MGYNLYVIYAAINDAIKNKKDLDIQFYDLAKCFDAMWAEETMNDIYDVGVRDEKFALISLINDKCKVKVKTPVGDTSRFELNRIEMQGTVPAPLKYAVQRLLHFQHWNLYIQRCMCCASLWNDR